MLACVPLHPPSDHSSAPLLFSQEADLTFAPTYKYEPKTDHYDRRPEKKLRCPAWCDRVLYKSKDMSQVRKKRKDTTAFQNQSKN